MQIDEIELARCCTYFPDHGLPDPPTLSRSLPEGYSTSFAGDVVNQSDLAPFHDGWGEERRRRLENNLRLKTKLLVFPPILLRVRVAQVSPSAQEEECGISVSWLRSMSRTFSLLSTPASFI